MDGTPESISIAVRMILTRILFFFVYSLRNTAVIIPTGTAITKLKATAISVETILGSIVIFSLPNSYFPTSKCGLVISSGRPFAKTKPIINIRDTPDNTPAPIAMPFSTEIIFIL